MWAADGAIATADHVVERDDDIRIGLADGRVVAATLAGRDPTTGVALLRAEAGGLAVPQWHGAEGIRAGNVVLALSRPGNTVRAQLAVVSAARPSWRTPSGGEVTAYLQTDLEPSWGFSGGLLVDASGKAIGMNTIGSCAAPRWPSRSGRWSASYAAHAGTRAPRV